MIGRYLPAQDGRNCVWVALAEAWLNWHAGPLPTQFGASANMLIHHSDGLDNFDAVILSRLMFPENEFDIAFVAHPNVIETMKDMLGALNLKQISVSPGATFSVSPSAVFIINRMQDNPYGHAVFARSVRALDDFHWVMVITPRITTLRMAA